MRSTKNRSVRSTANHSVRATANHSVRSAANHSVRSTANHSVRSTANHSVRSTANHSVRSTADQSARTTGWRKNLVNLAHGGRTRSEKKISRPSTQRNQNTTPTSKNEPEQHVKDDADLVVTSSNNYFLLKGNKNVAFDPGLGNPYKCLTVLNYDAFPVYVGEDRCLIKIEISSVNYLDCVIRHGRWTGNTSGFRDVPGMNIVGVVKIAGPGSSFKEGDRVAAIVKTGGNSRYTVCSSKGLLKIDHRDDAQSICAILSAYLPAFSMIHQGLGGYSERYKQNSLFGKDVLINGGMGNTGQAVIHLARILGAKNIYATGKKKDYRYLKEIGATPLPLGKTGIRESIDLIFDTTCTDMLGILTPMLTSKGRMILDHYGDISANGEHEFRTRIDSFLIYGKAAMAGDCYICDYLDNFNENFDLFQNDFDHLRSMLHNLYKLKPILAANLTLNEIAHAHSLLERTNIKGTLTCDPWSTRTHKS